MPIQTGQLSVLLIEDNPSDQFLLETMLRTSRLNITQVSKAERISEAIRLLDENSYDIVFLDLSLPDSFGLESFNKLRAFTAGIPVIILTGVSESAIATEAIKFGAQDYLVKGDFKPEMLVRSILYSIERKNAEERIIESEMKYRQMFYKNPFPTLIYDQDSLQILEVNDSAIRKFGYDRNEFLNLKLDEIRNDEIESPESETSGYSPRFIQLRKKNKNIIIAEITYYQIQYAGTSAMQAQINDVTEKLRLEKELAEQQLTRQRQVTEAVLQAQEKERKIIGAELHDNINQILATSKIYYEAAPGSENINEMISRGSEYISLAIEEILKLSRELVVPPFIETGLKQAILQVTQDMLYTKDISYNTFLDEFDENELDKEIKIAIYRIIQEQLNNIVKYAAPSQVDIHLARNGKRVTLSISDNGAGFDPSLRSEGIGLTNIRTRAELFKGKIEIDSSPGKGCRLHVTMFTNPVSTQKAA